MENQLDDFTSYIKSLCEKHVDILHSEEESHFIEIESEEDITSKTQYYPTVALDKLEISYTGPEDATRKQRSVELMFVNKAEKNSGKDEKRAIRNAMERVAEDFIKKIKVDKKNRQLFPFLKTLKLSDIRLNYIENKSVGLYGALLSFNFDLPFVEQLEDGRFVENNVLS